jgi:hypothetical protein
VTTAGAVTAAAEEDEEEEEEEEEDDDLWLQDFDFDGALDNSLGGEEVGLANIQTDSEYSQTEEAGIGVGAGAEVAALAALAAGAAGAAGTAGAAGAAGGAAAAARAAAAGGTDTALILAAQPTEGNWGGWWQLGQLELDLSWGGDYA